jgi:hypothetical protein
MFSIMLSQKIQIFKYNLINLIFRFLPLFSYLCFDNGIAVSLLNYTISLRLAISNKILCFFLYMYVLNMYVSISKIQFILFYCLCTEQFHHKQVENFAELKKNK